MATEGLPADRYQPTSSEPVPRLIIRDATVIDGTGAEPYQGTVVVAGSSIEKIYRGAAPPSLPEAAVIQGAGLFVIPGLVDLLTHVSIAGNVSGSLKDLLANEQESLFEGSVGTPDREKRLACYQDILEHDLRQGVTTFVDSVTPTEDVVALRARLDPRLHPDFLSLGPILGNRFGHPYPTDDTPWKKFLPEVPDDLSAEDWARLRSDDLAADPRLGPVQASLESFKRELDGMLEVLDGLKINVDMPAENGHPSRVVPEGLIAVVAERCRAHGKPLFFLASRDESLQAAARAGAQVKLGPPWVLGDFDPAKRAVRLEPLDETWRVMKEHGVGFLTLQANNGRNLQTYLESPEEFQRDIEENPTISPVMRQRYERLLGEARAVLQEGREALARGERPANPLFYQIQGRTGFADTTEGLLREAGQRGFEIFPSTDAGSLMVPHGGLWREFEYLSGVMSPQDALQGLTLDAARLMGRADRVGSVEEGKQADMVLLGSNPLTDPTALREVAAVIHDGAVVAR